MNYTQRSWGKQCQKIGDQHGSTPGSIGKERVSYDHSQEGRKKFKDRFGEILQKDAMELCKWRCTLTPPLLKFPC